MNPKVDFKKTLQVKEDEILDIKQIIKDLESGIQKYNGKLNSKSEENICRSGEIMIFDALLSAGLLFKTYETCGKTLDAHILTRIKSHNSISEKTQRIKSYNEEAVKKSKNEEELGDIIGSSLIADRVHNYAEIVNTFNSPEIQSRYNERQSNIALLKEVSEFILGLDTDENNIASDVDDENSKNNSELIARLNINKKNCRNIIKNCNVYLKEGKTKTKTKFPINRTLKSMCRYLIDEELQKAFRIIENNLAKEIESKNSIENELEKLHQYKDEDTQKIEYLESILSIQNQKIEMLKKQIELLKQNPEDRDFVKLKILLSNCLNTHRVDLLEDIEQHITDRIDDADDNEEVSIEKKYCEYLMLVLYQIKKLEYVNDKVYFRGKIYETVENSLYAQLEEYGHAEIGGNRYRNITFDDIQKLTTNLRRLNSRLSDKLQQEILDYSMQLYLGDVIKQFTGESPSKDSFKIKQNGYVARHMNIDLIKQIVEEQPVKLRKELKLVTHHRDIEATRGTAAYGSDRQDNMEAKKRNSDLLEDNLENHIKSVKGPKIKKVNFHANLIEQLQQCRENNYLSKLIHDTTLKDSTFAKSIVQKKEWEEQLFSVIPKYSRIDYDAKTDSVNITFLSDYENINKYYTETNVPIKRTKVSDQLNELKENGMVSDKPITITITHNQYRYFLRNQLPELRNSVISSLAEASRLDKKQVDSDLDVGEE